MDYFLTTISIICELNKEVNSLFAIWW